MEELDNIYTDLLMLQDESWEPDPDSVQSTIDMVKQLAKKLKLELIDTRENGS
jgi:hypothetical protein